MSSQMRVTDRRAAATAIMSDGREETRAIRAGCVFVFWRVVVNKRDLHSLLRRGGAFRKADTTSG